MRIALINENSQASKNDIIYKALFQAAARHGHSVDNYGMYGADDPAYITYVQCGLLAAILLNSGAADFVVTGCGTGEGAMLACNSFPGVECGLISEPLDAFLFSQINAGNAVSLPYAKGFGWGSELNLELIFENLFTKPFGGGYPTEKQEIERKNKQILDSIKCVTHTGMEDILQKLDRDFVKNALEGAQFKSLYFTNCKNDDLQRIIREILEE